MKWSIAINGSYVATADTLQEAIDYTRGGRCEIGVVTLTSRCPNDEEIALIGTNQAGRPDTWVVKTRMKKNERPSR